jgi:transposase-like protein
MRRARRILTPDFKAEVVRTALAGGMTVEEVAERYDVNPNQVCLWKRQIGSRATDSDAATIQQARPPQRAST